ncbi:hypothetical protein F2P56_032547 [Juglans regia]|uniref:Uncharacterized protein n=2 Tax=Juglans regia TaxID=51240 RepID=A0A833U5Q2_JUGRE|nr:uncharacterized protein At3g17950-like [Juglans regia]KAF5446954.1 hypothetical protein F2P56_032547 [Juglans regia]
MAAGQEEGWPLGLQPLNVRVGLVRNHDFSGSVSFNTLLTGSPTCSTDSSSSDLDTESTGSFFHDRSVTLGSLIGVSSILELSRRSIRRRKTEPLKEKKSSSKLPRSLGFFSLCLRDRTDGMSVKNPSSLRHFLAVERKTSAAADHDEYYQRNQNPINGIGPEELLGLAQPVTEPNSLFVNGRVAPPPQTSSGASNSDVGRRREKGVLDHEHGDHGVGVPSLFSCMCG